MTGNTSSLPTRIEQLAGQSRVPGFSIALVRDFEVAWSSSWGVKRAGGQDSVADSTLFQAGSISKPVSAAAVLRLVQEGELELDRDVNDFLNTWRVAGDHSVTLRQILSHRAGFTVHGFPGYPRTEPIPSLPELLDGKGNTEPIRIDIPPGTQDRYSGGGYCVLQLVVEDVTGKPFHQVARDLVLRPAGMTASTFEQPLPPPLHESAATGHLPDESVVEGGWHVYPEETAAGLWSTARDLARFVAEVQLANSGKSSKLLSQQVAQEMLSPQADPSRGLGPQLRGEGAAARFHHGGVNMGFMAWMVGLRDGGGGAAITTNFMSAHDLVKEAFEAIAETEGWPPVT